MSTMWNDCVLPDDVSVEAVETVVETIARDLNRRWEGPMKKLPPVVLEDVRSRVKAMLPDHFPEEMLEDVMFAIDVRWEEVVQEEALLIADAVLAAEAEKKQSWLKNKSFGNLVGHRWDSFLEKIYTLRRICCFTSLLTVFGFHFLAFPFDGSFGDVVLAVLWVVGVLSALIAAAPKVVGVVVVFGIIGAIIGAVCGLLVGALPGALIGVMIGGALMVYAPWALTIPYYICELRKNPYAL